MEQLRLELKPDETDLDNYASEKIIPSLNHIADNLGLWALTQREGIVELYKDKKRFVRSDEFAAATISMVGNGLIDTDEMGELFKARGTNKLALSYWHLCALYDDYADDFDERYRPIIEQAQDLIVEELEHRGYEGDIPAV